MLRPTYAALLFFSLGCEGTRVTNAETGDPLMITLVDENDDPIAGARVLLGELTAVTGADGSAELEAPAGPVVIHAFAEGRAPLTVSGIEMRSATFVMPSSANPREDEPKIARVSGLITGWDRLPPLVGGSRVQSERYAWVERASRQSRASWIQQGMRESGHPLNYSIGGALEDYAIDVDAPSTKALYAIGGLSTFDFESEEHDVSRTHLGLLMDLELDEGASLEGRNIDLGFALEPIQIDVRNLPSGMQVAGATSVILPRDNGLVPIGNAVEEAGALVARAPLLTGLLAEASIRADLFAADETADTYLSVDSTDRTVIADRFLAPPESIEQNGRTLSARFEETTGWQYFQISKLEPVDSMQPMPPGGSSTRPVLLWNVIDLSHDGDVEVELPSPPDGFADPLPDAEEIRAGVIEREGNGQSRSASRTVSASF